MSQERTTDPRNTVDPPRAAAQAAAADVGIFGPGSITWRLHSDPVLGMAGLRALMMQALHPLAAEAVSQHSAFRQDVWGRLTRTSEFVGVTTFGSTTQALSAGAHVRAVHAALSASDPETGDPYRIDTPELLGWVHVCLVDSVVEVMRRSGVGLNDADADAYVHEQVRAAVLVGLEPDEVPHDHAELVQYVADARPSLRATPAAREEVSYVIAPPIPARYAAVARPAWSAVAGLAFAALPSWARRMYSIPELPGAAALHGAATTVALHTLHASLRGVQGVVPALREGPHLRSARERLAAAPEPSSASPRRRRPKTTPPGSPRLQS